MPGLLLVVGALPFWHALRLRPRAQAIMRGINAAVVGILGAALYNPVWTSAIHDWRDFALAFTGFVLLTVWRAQPWIVVMLLTAATVALALAFLYKTQRWQKVWADLRWVGGTICHWFSVASCPN